MSIVIAKAIRKICINIPKDDLVTVNIVFETDEGDIIEHDYNLKMINETG